MSFRLSSFLKASFAAGAIVLCSAQLHSQSQIQTAAVAQNISSAPLNLQMATPSPDQSYSSSAVPDDSQSVTTPERANLGTHAVGPNPDASGDAQYGPPPPRRSPYGRPTYHSGNENADGSSKYGFEVGAGFTNPTGDTGHYQTDNLNFSVGGGRNFSKNFGVLLQYDYARFGIPASILNTRLALYNSDGYGLSSIGGNVHLWSITLNPIYYFSGGEKSGMYVVAGGGFYRKLTNFTTPETQEYCGIYGCELGTSNAVFDHYSNNAFGANAGLGYTYKLSRFSSAKLFAEARYTFVGNQANAHNNYATGGYPPNNYRTEYVPVTVGLRW